MSAAKHTPGPLPLSAAEYWEASARSLRIEASRARDFESKQLHMRDAKSCDEHAARIRASVAKATGGAA